MKNTSLFVIALAVITGGFLIFMQNRGVGGPVLDNDVPTAEGSNVTMENGKQVISIDVRGGYRPRKTIAKAGIPTVLRMNTENTFDCSSAIRIPSINYKNLLPSTGQTEIDLGTPNAGPLRGSCSMGMYSFEITFKD